MAICISNQLFQIIFIVIISILLIANVLNYVKYRILNKIHSAKYIVFLKQLDSRFNKVQSSMKNCQNMTTKILSQINGLIKKIGSKG